LPSDNILLFDVETQPFFRVYQFRTYTRMQELFRFHLPVRTHPNKSQIRWLNSGFIYNHSVQNDLFSHLQSKTRNSKIKRKMSLLYFVLVTFNVSVWVEGCESGADEDISKREWGIRRRLVKTVKWFSRFVQFTTCN